MQKQIYYIICPNEAISEGTGDTLNNSVASYPEKSVSVVTLTKSRRRLYKEEENVK